MPDSDYFNATAKLKARKMPEKTVIFKQNLKQLGDGSKTDE